MRRRLLFLNNQGLAAIGGGPTILRHLTAALAEDHTITPVSEDRASGAGFTELQVPPFAVPDDARWRLHPWLKARHLVRHVDASLIRSAHIVIALDPHFVLCLEATRPRRLIHLSLSCVTRQEWFGSHGTAAAWFAAQYGLLERRLARAANGIIVASPMHAREMARFAGCRGRALAVFPPVFGVPHAEAGEHRRGGFVAIGRLTPVKNLEALFPVLRRLPGTDLALLGEGDDPAPLRRLAEREGVADRVVWVGAVEDPTGWIDRAAILLHPSRYESFGMVVHEAMRRGTVPVVFGQGPGRMNAATDLVRHGQSGLHVDYDDPESAAAAIRALLARPDRLLAMSAAARAAAAERDRFDYVARFRALLETVEASA